MVKADNALVDTEKLFEEKTSSIIDGMSTSMNRIVSSLSGLLINWADLLKAGHSASIVSQLVNQENRDLIRPYVKNLNHGDRLLRGLPLGATERPASSRC